MTVVIDGYLGDKEMLKRVADTFGLPLWKGPVIDLQETLQKEGVPKMKQGEEPWEWALRVTEYARSRSRTRSASTASSIRTRDNMEDEQEESEEQPTQEDEEDENEEEESKLKGLSEVVQAERAPGDFVLLPSLL